jgi:NAD(P)H dehydrogenase (quinone)
MSTVSPILVTGAAGQVGGVGGLVTRILLGQKTPVRAFVRRDDERAEALRQAGADIFVGDLTQPEDVARALESCRRIYFGMSVSAAYLEAAIAMAAVARQQAGIEVLVHMSQMTVSQMSLRTMTASPQQRQHWLAEQALNWSGLPVVHIRPTVFQENFFFLDWAAEQIRRDGTIRLPFGSGRTSPVSAQDVAEVVAAVLLNPAPHIGKVYELTGPRSQDLHGFALEYAAALGRPVRYASLPLHEWRDKELRSRGLPQHVFEHLLTMAQLHAANGYDRLTSDVEAILRRPARSIETMVRENRNKFGGDEPDSMGEPFQKEGKLSR